MKGYPMGYGYNATTHHAWGTVRTGKAKATDRRSEEQRQIENDKRAVMGYAGAGPLERRKAFERLKAQGVEV
jgi:hypothetical protein